MINFFNKKKNEHKYTLQWKQFWKPTIIILNIKNGAKKKWYKEQKKFVKPISIKKKRNQKKINDNKHYGNIKLHWNIIKTHH